MWWRMALFMRQSTAHKFQSQGPCKASFHSEIPPGNRSKRVQWRLKVSSYRQRMTDAHHSLTPARSGEVCSGAKARELAECGAAIEEKNRYFYVVTTPVIPDSRSCSGPRTQCRQVAPQSQNSTPFQLPAYFQNSSCRSFVRRWLSISSLKLRWKGYVNAVQKTGLALAWKWRSTCMYLQSHCPRCKYSFNH